MSATRDLADRTAIVTGATSGIGYETALGLASRGARVVLVGRDVARTEATRDDLRRRSGSDSVEIAIADLASLAAVRGVAAELRERFGAVHVLVNNAGVVMTRRALTEDGYETTLAVNHLAPFLLTHLLRDALQAGAPSRVVNVASNAHRLVAGFDFDDPMVERGFGFAATWTGLRVYCMSKLANVLFTQELARRLAGSGVTANAVHPGGVSTRLGHNNGAAGTMVTLALRPFFKTPAQGAETSLFAATSPELANVTGRYFADCREQKPSAAAQNAEAAGRLWRESCRWVGLDEDAAASDHHAG